TSVTTRLFTLDEQTLVYPGHDYKSRRVSTIGEERLFNACFTGKTREEFLAIMANLNLAMPARIHEAVPANLDGGSRPAPQEPRKEHDLLSVSPRQFAELAQGSGAELIDVRTPREF